MTDALDEMLAVAEADLPAALGRLFEFLRIPSVGAQPARAKDCLRAAEWAAAQLAGLGFAASVRPTPGHPMVVAHHPGPADAPHLLYYGHYDVQPADRSEGWHSDPFEPVLLEGPRGRRIVARGAVDDKGQIMTVFEAFRAWKTVVGALPARVTVFLEGEEESGSPSLDAFLTAARSELAADVCLVCDMSMWDDRTPAITTRMRGMCYAEVTLHGPSRDLHSGRYGGAALNPLNELVRILGDLHDADGRVHLPGFYDRVRPIAPTELESWRSLSFDEAAYLADVGLSKPRGEHGCSGLERLWGRPAADINGLTGGYGGDGAKTVIPTHGSAKVSFRLIPDQDPKEIFAQFRRFVEARLPDGARATFRSHTMAPGVVVPVDTPWMRAARDAFSAEFGRETVLVGAGGTIPAVHALQRVLGLDPLLVGVGLNDDQNHGPNEKFELACFRHGIRAHLRLLGRLAAVR